MTVIQFERNAPDRGDRTYQDLVLLVDWEQEVISVTDYGFPLEV